MSSTEINGWKEYFNIYPFTQDREDYRIALLASVIYNTSGKTFKKSMDMDKFLPDYLKQKITVRKSLEQQKAEALAWATYYKSHRGK
jgi:hypothetical protein